MNSLKGKLLSLLMVTFFCLGILNFGLYRWAIYPTFTALEKQEAVTDASRAVQAIEREIFHLDTLCHDWAAWDDTYDFIDSYSSEYISSNLPLSSFTDNRLNLIAFYDINGKNIWHRSLDYLTGEPIEFKLFPASRISENHTVLSFKTAGAELSDVKISGIVMTGRGMMLMSSRPVLKGDNTGPIRGAVIMGRLLDNNEIKRLSGQTTVPFNLTPLSARDDAAALLQKGSASKESHYIFEYTNDDMLRVHTILADIGQKDILRLTVDVERKITQRGKTVIRFAMFSVAAAAVLMFVLLFGALHRFILEPVTRLTQFTLNTGKTGDLFSRTDEEARDEIGVLASQINRMLTQLAESRQKLLEQSRRSGMAEISSEIIHSIRNALVPLVAPLHAMRKQLEQAPAGPLQAALSELKTYENPQQRYHDLIELSVLAGNELNHLIGQGKKDIQTILDKLTTVELYISQFEKWAHDKKIFEYVKVSYLIDEAVKEVARQLDHMPEVTIDGSTGKESSVYTHPPTLMRIICGVLMNAAESVIRTERADGQIKISIQVEGSGKNTVFQVIIIDNGDGIAKENISRVFDRVFSTKSGGGSGIGLHWCANAVNLLGGRIQIFNGEANEGVKAVIRIPAGMNPGPGEREA